MFERELPCTQPTTTSYLTDSSDLILFDAEFTAWPGSLASNWSRPGEVREMFQWGLVHAKKTSEGKFIEVAAASIYIKTVLVPELPEYSVNLTGVTQQQLDKEGIPFKQALARMFEFSYQGSIPVLSYGSDRNVLAENCSLLSCSPPQFNTGFINIRPSIHAADPRTGTLSSGQLYTLVPDSGLTGHVHNALHDVRSILAYLNYLISASQTVVR
jgi:hypothetical protein